MFPSRANEEDITHRFHSHFSQEFWLQPWTNAVRPEASALPSYSSAHVKRKQWHQNSLLCNICKTHKEYGQKIMTVIWPNAQTWCSQRSFLYILALTLKKTKGIAKWKQGRKGHLTLHNIWSLNRLLTQHRIFATWLPAPSMSNLSLPNQWLWLT